jgi:hypothetical protein
MPFGRVGSLPAPTPEQREYTELLLEHATSDLGACRVLMAAEDMRDDVVGFHAQQAVEKALKVSLVLADVDFLALTISESWWTSPPTTTSRFQTRFMMHVG